MWWLFGHLSLSLFCCYCIVGAFHVVSLCSVVAASSVLHPPSTCLCNPDGCLDLFSLPHCGGDISFPIFPILQDFSLLRSILPLGVCLSNENGHSVSDHFRFLVGFSTGASEFFYQSVLISQIAVEATYAFVSSQFHDPL